MVIHGDDIYSISIKKNISAFVSNIFSLLFLWTPWAYHNDQGHKNLTQPIWCFLQFGPIQWNFFPSFLLPCNLSRYKIAWISKSHRYTMRCCVRRDFDLMEKMPQRGEETWVFPRKETKIAASYLFQTPGCNLASRSISDLESS